MISEGTLIQRQYVRSLDELRQKLYSFITQNPGRRIAFWGYTYPTTRTLAEFERILAGKFEPVCIIDNFKHGEASFSKTVPILSFAEAERRADGIDLIVVMVDTASIYDILAQVAGSRLSEKALLTVHRDTDPLTETEFLRIKDSCQADLTRRGVLWYTSDANWYCGYQYLKQTASLEGDVAEFGVFQGGCSYFLATLLRHMGLDEKKRLWLFDTFQGIPDQSPLDHAEKESFSAREVGRVRELFGGFPNVELVAGDVCETVGKSGMDRLALAHIDCDQHRPTRFLCETLYPRMVRGGILMFQNYSLGGAYGERVAVDTFFRGKPESVLIGYDGAAFVVKL